MRAEGARPPSAGLRVAAAAKINLTLGIVGRRGDGYHLIESFVVFADLADLVGLAPAERFALRVAGTFAGAAGPAASNLAAIAAHRLAALVGREPALRLTLTKSLPVAAGLGGGSSDAAAVLTGMERLWRLDLEPERRDRLALGLGADVPVCLFGRPAFVSGIGERVAAAPPLPDLHLVLANPGMRLAAGDVYARRRGPFSPPRGRPPAVPRDAAGFAAWLGALPNDLTAAAAAAAPAVERVLTATAAQEGCLLARMTGSGPTCFGMFAQAEAAARAARRIGAAEPSWWVRAAAVRAACPVGRSSADPALAERSRRT